MKRSRDATGANDDALKFIPGLTLSQHPLEQRKGLFMKKLDGIIQTMSLHPTQFEGYAIRERFKKMGWEKLLNFKCDKIYRHVVVQWMSSLSKKGDELTGIVNGKPYTITPKVIRDILGVDTRTDLPYARYNEADFEAATDKNRRRWVEACKTVFGLQEKVEKQRLGYDASKMMPLVQILWRIGVSTFHPRPHVGTYCFPSCKINIREIYLLHALYTGYYLYSFAHLMIDDIWDMYEHDHRCDIPHGHYISEILNRLGAVSEDEYVEHAVSPEFCIISTGSFFPTLKFSESPTEYTIDNGKTGHRVIFPKKAKKEAKPQPTPELSQSTKKQSSKFKKLLKDMQKQMEHQALQAEHREQEREKKAEEREKRADERERKAEIRGHAMIWYIERQRYLYEKDQEQLRMVWNQMSRNSLHPPRQGSQYAYDPTQGDEIPKVFQSFFQDIYGPIRKEHPSP